jgi:hypothetical protein
MFTLDVANSKQTDVFFAFSFAVGAFHRARAIASLALRHIESGVFRGWSTHRVTASKSTA